MKLTEQQTYALWRLSRANNWLSSYALDSGRNTLDALVKRGLAERRMGPGSIAFPRTAIEYRITEAGKREADHE